MNPFVGSAHVFHEFIRIKGKCHMPMCKHGHIFNKILFFVKNDYLYIIHTEFLL